MKRFKLNLFIILITLCVVQIILAAKYSDKMLKISFAQPYEVKEIESVINDINIYDYLILYELFNNEYDMYVYKGNINMILEDNVISENVKYDENDVLIGDGVIKNTYLYNPYGEVIDKTRVVSAVLKDSDSLYYSDMKLLENNQIMSQTLHCTLIDAEGKILNKNRVLSILHSSGLNVTNIIVYEYVTNYVKVFILLLGLCILFILINEHVNEIKLISYSLLSNFYENENMISARSYIKKSNNKISLMIYKLSSLLILALLFIYIIIIYNNIELPSKFVWVSLNNIKSNLVGVYYMVKNIIKSGPMGIELYIVSAIGIILVEIISIIVIEVYSSFNHIVKLIRSDFGET